MLQELFYLNQNMTHKLYFLLFYTDHTDFTD